MPEGFVPKWAGFFGALFVIFGIFAFGFAGELTESIAGVVAVTVGILLWRWSNKHTPDKGNGFG